MTNKNNKPSNSGGIGFCGALTIAFIILKLCKVIHWSWIWVLSPIWIPVAIALVVFIIITVTATVNVIRGRRND